MLAFYRLRAASVIGLTWALTWALVGVGLATLRVFLLEPRLITPVHYWRGFATSGALAFGALGSIAGLLFALRLSKARQVTSVDDLSLADAALWGGIAGAVSIAVMPIVGLAPLPLMLLGATFSSAVGAASAMLTVSAARGASSF